MPDDVRGSGPPSADPRHQAARQWTRVDCTAIEGLELNPVDAIRALAGLADPVALSGSWAGGGVILAAEPIRTSADCNLAPLLLPGQTEWLKQSDLPPGAVGGGWFGWFDYPESWNSPNPSDRRRFAFYPNVVRYSALSGRWYDEALVGEVDQEEMVGRRHRLTAALRLFGGSERAPAGKYRAGSVRSSRSRAGHTAAVEQCITRMRAGDFYQANLSIQLTGSFAGDPTAMFADLVGALNPAYGAMIGIGPRTLVSASPELFLRQVGSRVESAPIKGTRPTGERFTRAAAELRESVKEQAENVMIVDLVRNDLGRVAVPGSVRIPALLSVEEHVGVWHMLSRVSARLRSDVEPEMLLAATFPPASVTGAPKSAAMKAIAELEDVPRGVYTGAIGYLSPVAGLELNVAIRTLDISGGRFRLGVGGGITVDSNPVEEWWECFDKAAPVIASIGSSVLVDDHQRPESGLPATGGFYETMLVIDGRIVGLTDHLARIQGSLRDAFRTALPPGLRDELEAEARGFAAEDRRSGPTESPGAATAQSSRPGGDGSSVGRMRFDLAVRAGVVELTDLAVQPAERAKPDGAVAAIAPGRHVLGRYKASDRSVHTALEDADPGADVVVVRGTSDECLETTRGNLFAVIDDVLVTPPADGRILPGIARRVLLDIARDLRIQVDLRPLSVDDLMRADGVAVSGSIRGLQWVRQLRARQWIEPHPMIRSLEIELWGRWGTQRPPPETYIGDRHGSPVRRAERGTRSS